MGWDTSGSPTGSGTGELYVNVGYYIYIDYADYAYQICKAFGVS